MTPESSLSNIITSVNLYLQRYANTNQSPFIQFLKKTTFLQTEQQKNLEDVDWEKNDRRVFFGSYTNSLTPDEIRNRIKQTQNEVNWNTPIKALKNHCKSK